MPGSTVISWSGGKDAMMCLHRLREAGEAVTALVATVGEDDGWVTGQGVPEALLRRQARALGLPLRVAYLPASPSNELYRERVGEAFLAADAARVAFGDLFLADIRRWREEFLGGLGMEALFPLWGEDTAGLIRAFLEAGYRGWITCVDTRMLAAHFAGRPLDGETVSALPAGVDPCGENGEFHSFVWGGPGFAGPVACRPGRVVRRRHMAICPPVALDGG